MYDMLEGLVEAQHMSDATLMVSSRHTYENDLKWEQNVYIPSRQYVLGMYDN